VCALHPRSGLSRLLATVTELEDSPVAAVLLELGPNMSDDWSRSPSDLRSELTALAGKKGDSPRWANSPTWLTIELRRIAPQFGIHGIFVHSKRDKHRRVLSMTRDRKAPEKNGDMPVLISDEQMGLEPDNPEKWHDPQV